MSRPPVSIGKVRPFRFLRCKFMGLGPNYRKDRRSDLCGRSDVEEPLKLKS